MINQTLEKMESDTFDAIKMFTGNGDKFLQLKTAMESINDNPSKEICIDFVLTKIIPTVFDKNVDNIVRDQAMDIGFCFLKHVNVSILHTKDQESIFISIEETYAKIIGELRDAGYGNWDKLWIFLVQLCGEKLHMKMSLANKLLRVVEVAFRNSTSIEQRLKAYDCWTELINNSSLNMEHMCSAKQIKLLVTPMKAKFSRMPVVILKRCDTFVYLLEKLGDKATLCLKEFLEFCFGPFEEKNDEKMKQGRSVPEVCNKSTKVLMEIIGHSHDESESCIKNDDIKLYKPLINEENFPNFAEILINSVIECCILLSEWNHDFYSNNTIVKCLWKSILKLVNCSTDEVQKKCCMQINTLLQKLLEKSERKQFHLLLGNVLNLLIQDEKIQNFKEILFNIGMDLLCHVPKESWPLSIKKLLSFLSSCFEADNSSNFDKIASNYFKRDTNVENSNELSEIWLKCELTVTPAHIYYIVWPVHHLQNFKDIKRLNSKWTQLYKGEGKAEIMKVIILQEMEKLFLENPLLSSNVVSFLQLISATETNSSKDFVAKFMKVIELVLTLPNLSESNVKKLSTIVLKYCNLNQYFYKTENNDEAIDKLCVCLEHLVANHKDYTILAELAFHLRDGQPNILLKFSKRLMSFLETLMLNEDNSVANTTRKLIELLETKEKEVRSSSASTRSLRIINMTNTPRLINTRRSSKEVHKSSPLTSERNKLISSPQESSRTVESKKKNSILMNDDKSSDYVKIDSEIKINVDNLKEHQKEMFKKRRDDIPALYEDLTQSQSQDIFKSLGKVTINRTNEDLSTPEQLNNETNEDLSPPKKKKRSDYNHSEYVKKNVIIDQAIENADKDSNTDSEAQISSTVEGLIQFLEDVAPDLSSKQFENKSVEQESVNGSVQLDSKVVVVEPNVPPQETKDQNISPKLKNKSEKSVRRSKRLGLIEIEETFVQNNSGRAVENCQEIKVKNNVSESKTKEEPLKASVYKNKKGSTQQEKVLNETEKQPLEKSTEKIKINRENENLIPQNFEDGQKSQENEDKINDSNWIDIDENESTVSLRKSKRQVHRKYPNEYVMPVQRKTKSVVNVKKSQRKQHYSSEKIEKKQFELKHKNDVEEESKENSTLDDKTLKDSISELKKKHKRHETQDKTTRHHRNSDESKEDSLTKIDVKVEDKAEIELSPKLKQENMEKDTASTMQIEWSEPVLQDGNQNKVISLPVHQTKVHKKLRELKVISTKNSRGKPAKGKKPANVLINPVVKVENILSKEVSPKKPIDIYEFKNEDETLPVEQTKKTLKKKKSNTCLNTRDYISKRRKKSKKEIKEVTTLPLNVTADSFSSLPLSESQSLRVVPAPEGDDNILIQITRSPPRHQTEVDENKKSPEENDTVSDEKTVSPKRKSRRKQSPNSEDVIESSQITPDNDTNKRKVSSPRNSRSFKQTRIDEVIKPLLDVTPNSSKRKVLDLPETETMSINVVPKPSKEKNEVIVFTQNRASRKLSLTEPITEKIELSKRTKRSHSLDKFDFITDTCSKSSNPEITDTTQNSDMLADTLTCEAVVTGLEKPNDVSHVTESPVKNAVKEETKEDLPGSPITCDTPDRTKELLNNTLDISPINTGGQGEVTTPRQPTNEMKNVRVARLLQMVNSSIQVSNSGGKWFGNKHPSPSTSKVRKMRIRKEENLDILTFSREVPSPLTLPASGILKRKLSHVDEGTTPPPKRKRVNFSDPAISDKKIFIKDSEEYDDDNENPDRTNESHDLSEEGTNQETNVSSDAVDKEEMLLVFKNFCDLNFKGSLTDSNVKSALVPLLQNLKVPEIVEIISEYVTSSDSGTLSEVYSALFNSESSQQIIDKCVLPSIQNGDICESFLPKLLNAVEKLPGDKLKHITEEFTKIFEENCINADDNKEFTQEQVQDYVVNKFDCDSMNDLIKKYFLNLEGQRRNEFLVGLMNLASSELPVNMKFVNCHINILQDFVKKMTE